MTIERAPRYGFTASDGTELRYEVDDFTPPWTQPETIILMHAAMGSSRRFHHWVPALSGKYRVVRPDLRGHGTSEASPKETVTIDRLAQDFLELMDHLGLDKAHVVGSSTGGIIALGLGLGRTAKELLELYERRGPVIFGQDNADDEPLGRIRQAWRTLTATGRHVVGPKHDAAILARELKAVLNNDLIGQSQTRLVILIQRSDVLIDQA